MKTLYLMRHAKSSWSFDTLNDQQRPLNDRGRDDAPLMGRALAEREVELDLIVSSPAVRALSTAALVAKELEHSPEQLQVIEGIYEATVPDLLTIVQQLPDSAAAVLLVGHNNTLTDFANLLSPSEIPPMPTASIACLKFKTDQWADVSQANAEYYFFDKPKNY
ncbi:SixA phosphatase family protein [Hymenobacter rubripertinctus]|uniref:Histidine phosphatase family protein n=1 Tax=Hymenobacter rubripertinctus TaxID=2029981 RepID=A0A418QY26_9BACT|nr:histidine phosphatase family protein [Hymenobacter rubripertinctus]RIY10051.1 histidine phosphatase family protein [Hymenobacter rubripertinctus]